MVNDLSSIDDLELMPLGGGYMVRRERLMNELLAKGRKAGIVVLYAPDGFGKTSVLLQYTHEVKCDPTRGPVRIIEADRATGREVFMQLEVVTEELKDKPHSLIAIDNVPNLDQHDTEDLIDRIRGLRAMGVGVFISCRPSNRQLIHGLGDSVKINAQMLKVHAYEYSAWASAFSISTSLDFYQLTQGARAVIVTGGIVEVPPAAHVVGLLLRVCASTAADDGNHAARHCQRRFRRHAVARAGDDDFAVLNGHKALFLVLRLVAGDAVLAGCDRHRAAGDGHAILALDAVPQRSHADIAVLDFQVFRTVDTVVKVAQHSQAALALDFQVNLALQRTAGCFFALRRSGNIHFFAGLQVVPSASSMVTSSAVAI